MAEQIPSGQEPQPSAEDVVVFSPELLKLAKQRQRRLRRRRADGRELSLWHRRRAERYEPGVLLVQPIRTG